MWTLGFDSTAATVTVCLTRDGIPVSSYSADSSTSHSTTLLPAIERLLDSAGIKSSDLSLISCSAGPGSFTGVRIGVATAKGLAAPYGTSVIGVSSLEAMAYMFKELPSVVCPVLAARRGNVYTAIFASDGCGNVTRLTEDELVSLADLRDFLCSASEGYEGQNLYLTGDSVSEATEALNEIECFKLVPTPVLLASPSAYGVAACAYDKYISADECDRDSFTGEALLPIYLRKSQAEREKEEKQNR